MAPLYDTEVRPGDVISSALFTDMITKLQELEDRIATLEGGGNGGTTGAPRITATVPSAQQNVGLDLELIGDNFVVPASANQVNIDGVRATQFLAGSTSAALRFLIPRDVSVAAGGENVEIRVSNANGSHSILFRVLPEIAAPPTPVIESVVNDDGSAPPLRINQMILINGANFADSPDENQITFRVTSAAGTVTYPLPGQDLEIDTGVSTTSQIRCRLPLIEEAPVFVPVPVTLEIRVGASPPATSQITVLRTP